MSNLWQDRPAIFWLGSAAALPDSLVPLQDIKDGEADRIARQLSGLSPSFRDRLTADLGIEAVRRHRGPPSALALAAAEEALREAAVDPSSVRLVVDFSTLPGDYPGVWSLASAVADGLGLAETVTIGAKGAGCAGLVVALRMARALLWAEPELAPALLVTADCLPQGGRACLPISIMGDGAGAVVLGTESLLSGRRPRLLSAITSTLPAHHSVIVGQGSPVVTEIDGRAFQDRILPVHLLLCQRVLARALTLAGRSLAQVTDLVYPNTNALDRTSILRALGLSPAILSGPGPSSLGHSFASDLVTNFPVLARQSQNGFCAALLAVGSGFTWGAGIVA